MKLNRRLTEMVKDVELPRTVPDLERAAYDRTAVAMVLDTLEIRNPSLRERLFAVDPGAEEAEATAPVAEGVELDGTVLGAGELKPWLAEHGKTVLGVATVDSWALGTGSVAEVALAAADGAAAWFDPTQLDEADDTSFEKWLADPDKPKVMHNAKGAMRVFAEHGWSIEGVSMDTALAAYLVKPGRRSFALDALSLEYLGRELGPAAAADGQLAFGTDEQAEADALMAQARTILDLGEAFGEKLAEVGAADLLRDMELPTSTLLARMERHGIAADKAHLEAMEQMFAGAVQQAVKEAHAAAGHEFNLGSPKQLQEVLFGELALPKTKKTKTGYTTDADALAWLATQTENELPVIMLRHREQAKLRSTVEGLIKTIAADGRIHTTFNQTVAATEQALLHGPEPAEHPGPHGRGPRDPPRLRGRRGLRVVDDRGLQPDRTPCDGPSVRGRGPVGGVHVGRGPAHHGGLPGLLGRAFRGGRGDAPQDQGDVLRPGVRAVGLRPLPAAEHRRG